MVCVTLRWRGADSNFQYAEAAKLVVALFFAPIASDGSAHRSQSTGGSGLEVL